MNDTCATIGAFTSRLLAAYRTQPMAVGGTREEGDQTVDRSDWLVKTCAKAKLQTSTKQAYQLLQAAVQSRNICCSSRETERNHTHCHAPSQQPLSDHTQCPTPSHQPISDHTQCPIHTPCPAPSQQPLSWGEFCVCCSELQFPWQPKLPCTPGQGGKVGRTPLTSVTSHDPDTLSHKYDVFLGGSCNPTSWRKDVAIPILQREGITYYNPQVDEWYPELIRVEEEAKEAASKLLFVVDNQTRSVATMVEVSYFAGSGCNVLVVVDDIDKVNPAIGGERLSPREVADLNRGRAFVRRLAEKQGSLLETTVHQAVCTLVDISRLGQTVFEYVQDSQPEHQDPHHLLGDKLRLLRQVYSMYNTRENGRLTLEEMKLALHVLHIEADTLQQLRSNSTPHQEFRNRWLLWEQEGISFDEFCVMYSEAQYLQLVRVLPTRLLDRAVDSVSSAWSRVSNWLWSSPSPPLTPPPPHHAQCDVFLGGSCGSTVWRRDDIIPILQQYEVSFFNPQIPNWDSCLIPFEERAKEQCSVLLFVITGDTLGVASLVEAVYYIGCGRRLVLSLSDIPQPREDTGFSTVEGMKLSPRAVKDYNRGRAYLTSIATKHHIPIFPDPTEAALCAVYMVKGYRIPSNQNIPLQGSSV